MKQLTKKRKIEIANELIDETEFADAFKRHRAAIRELILKAIDVALNEADDKEPCYEPVPGTVVWKLPNGVRMKFVNGVEPPPIDRGGYVLCRLKKETP